jgi:hypothetical protein
MFCPFFGLPHLAVRLARWVEFGYKHPLKSPPCSAAAPIQATFVSIDRSGER